MATTTHEKDDVRQGAKCSLSIVMVCLNDKEHLEKTLSALAPQLREEVEVVIIDGGSIDGSREVIEEFQSRFFDHVVWLSEKDKGIYDAMNKGIALARGARISFLNAGDSYLPGVIDAIIECPESTSVLYGATELADERGRVIACVSSRPETLAQRHPNALVANHQSMAFPARALTQLGGFDTCWPIAADYELFCRCVEHGVEFRDLQRPMARFLLGGVSTVAPGLTAKEYRDIKIARGCPKPKAHLVYAKNRLVQLLWGKREAR